MATDFEKKVTLIEVDIDQDQAIKDVDKMTNAILDQKDAIKDNTAEIRTLEKSSKELATEVKKGNVTQEEATKQTEENIKKSNDLKKANFKLGDELKELNKERANAVKVSKLQANSLDALRKKTGDMVKERGALNRETVEGAKRFDKLTKEIKENQDAIVGNDKAAGQFKSSIGDYAGSAGEAGGAIGGLSGAVVDGGQKFLSFGKILLANPIGIIVTAVIALVGLFAKLGDNVSFLEPIMAGVQAVIGAVIGRLAKLGGAIVKLFKGDFAGAVADAKSAFTGLGEEIVSAFNKGKEIKQLEQALRALKRTSAETIATLQGEAELLQVIADDATASFAQRERAAEAARKAQEGALALRLDEAKLEKRIVEERLALAKSQGKDIRDLQDERAAAAVAQIDLENELTIAIKTNQIVRSQLVQDRLEKDLDILIDGFDNFKTITERAIADTDKPMEERVALLRRLSEESVNSFDKQTETIQQFSDKQIDINDLINESDSVALNNKIRNLGLSEIIEGRLLEVIRERRIVLADLNEAEKDLRDERIERDEAEAERQQEAAEEAAELAHDQLLERLQADQEARDEAAAIEVEEFKKKEQTKKDILQAAVDFAEQAISLGFDIAADRRTEAFDKEFSQLDADNQRKQDQLKTRLDNGLISQADFDRQSAQLERDAATEGHAIQVAQFKSNRRAALVEIAINTAIAVAKALASAPPPANFIAAGIAGGAGALQATAVLATRPPPAPQFARGGDVYGSIVGGRLHSEGGTKYKGEDGNQFEVEKGEGIFVTKRSATNPALALLSGINQRFGGASMFGGSQRFLQQGGNASAGIGATEITQLATEIAEGIPAPIVMVGSLMAGINADVKAKEVGIK